MCLELTGKHWSVCYKGKFSNWFLCVTFDVLAAFFWKWASVYLPDFSLWPGYIVLGRGIFVQKEKLCLILDELSVSNCINIVVGDASGKYVSAVNIWFHRCWFSNTLQYFVLLFGMVCVMINQRYVEITASYFDLREVENTICWEAYIFVASSLYKVVSQWGS